MTGTLQSSAYEVELEPENVPISPNQKILTNDIPINKQFLNGESGLIRLLFSFNTPSDFEVTVTKKGKADLLGFPLKLNADFEFILKSDGYYRFDISVKLGDLINLSCNMQISQINELQVQRIQTGV